MSFKATGENTNTNQTPQSQYGFVDLLKKPVEIYVFIDPLCPQCWSLEPFLKKLTLEYGRYFTIRPIISGKLTSLNAEAFQKPEDLAKVWEKVASRTGMSCDGDLWFENPVSSPWMAALSIKAAELQGKKAGMRFLRKIQENLFLNKQNISNEEVLLRCAEESNLDVEEFKQDLQSDSAKRALQCDLKLTREMEVEEIPAIVLFNQEEEEEGIKITGLYPYNVYVNVLQEMMQKEPPAATKPALEEFLKQYRFVGTHEISVVFDWSESKTECEMKKLQLKQKVEKHPVKYGTFWRYIK
ncbi:dithiol-disulfide isomerase [Pontibacillus chungwhensis BH030062]|uniref:ClpXP adapter protein SpxH n=1 Tax=Pontibacillus chungwhensis BH030062 TaxID=1385513 RepID=A0A0A2UW33_9BACI|nr:ClpXP adapter SpxH family protein [Pontibacillus chungwhensis]KGP90711.1 dithiol-disulfide isomerase [Pontibacillus chungwhensis BH030062]